MIKPSIEDTLEALARKYIPEGIHEYLHINSRDSWVETMMYLVEAGTIECKPSVLIKCANNWEIILTRKISILN